MSKVNSIKRRNCFKAHLRTRCADGRTKHGDGCGDRLWLPFAYVFRSHTFGWCCCIFLGQRALILRLLLLFLAIVVTFLLLFYGLHCATFRLLLIIFFCFCCCFCFCLIFLLFAVFMIDTLVKKFISQDAYSSRRYKSC